MRKILIALATVLATMLAILVPAGAAHAALPSTKVPADCTIQPGRVQVATAPAPAKPNTVLVNTLSINCANPYKIRELITMSRYFVSSKTWSPERAWRVPLAASTYQIQNIAGFNGLAACITAGALMSVSANYKFFDGTTGKVVANVTFAGRATALCPRNATT